MNTWLQKKWRAQRWLCVLPRSIYQYSNMDLSLSGQNSIFGGVFFVFKSLLGIERQKKLSKNSFWPESLGVMSEYIERGQTQNHVCACHFFCSQVFKTSDVLHSDENIVNIALIAFCSLAVTNLAHWATSSLRQWNAIYQNPVKAKTNDNCVTNYRPASDPHESKGGEIRDTKALNLSLNIVSLLVLGRCFAWSTCHTTKTFVASWRNAACWFVDLPGVDPSQVASLVTNEQQSLNLLLKVVPRSTFRSNFPQPAIDVFVARQVDHARWKTRNIDPKRAAKRCC